MLMLAARSPGHRIDAGLSRLAVAVIVILAVSLAAMGGFIMLGQRQEAATTAPTPSSSKEEILRVGFGTDLDTLDPHGQTSITVANVMRHVYETLLWVDKGGKPIPWLAERWEVSPDGLAYTFYLRKGVVFHDEAEFNAAAVKANIDRWLDPTARVPLRSQLGPIDRAEVVDGHTVRIYLKEPYAPFLRALASYLLIASPDVLSKARNAAITDLGDAVGTGPYRLASWEKGRRAVLERFDSCWGYKPPIKRIEWIIIPEASTRLAALLAGDVDLIYAAPAPDLQRLQGDPRFKVITPTSNLIMFLALAPKGPLADPRVRQALNHAIDRQAIINSVLLGLGDEARAPIPSHFFGYTEMPPIGTILRRLGSSSPRPATPTASSLCYYTL